jgi:hypothetical protein
VSKRWFAWTATYGVDIAEREDDILILASTVVIDMACQRRMVAVRLDRRLAARVDASDVVQETLVEVARRLDDDLRERGRSRSTAGSGSLQESGSSTPTACTSLRSAGVSRWNAETRTCPTPPRTNSSGGCSRITPARAIT